MPVPVALQIIDSKILPAPISPMSARSLQENLSSFWNSLSPTASSATVTGCSQGSPVSSVISNIYMEYFESLAISSFQILIKWLFRYVDDVHSATRKNEVNKLQELYNSIDPHIEFTPRNRWAPFLDTLTKPTSNSIESTVYRKPTHTQIGT